MSHCHLLKALSPSLHCLGRAMFTTHFEFHFKFPNSFQVQTSVDAQKNQLPTGTLTQLLWRPRLQGPQSLSPSSGLMGTA